MGELKDISPRSSEAELKNWKRLVGLFEKSPIARDELLANLGLYMPRQVIMRLLFFHELYQQIISTPGVVMEFGCRWGVNLSYLVALRGIYEPYNHNRRIIGFDTFSGLKGRSDKDGNSPLAVDGKYATASGYQHHLKMVLDCLEAFCPLAHIQKFEIVPGDVREALPAYLRKNPQTIVSLAYFDMDLYEPTKAALELILPHAVKGTIIGFDELNWSEMPGPTLALKEILGMRYPLKRSPLQPIPGYVVVQ